MITVALILGGAILYVMQAIVMIGIFELSLVGSPWNKPAIVIALGMTWPVSWLGMLIRDAIKARRA